MRHSEHKSYFMVAQTGCLLPLAVVFNLFFGWMFLKLPVWLGVEAALILLFMINSYFLAKRISGMSARVRDAVDIEGEVVEERGKIE